MKNVLFLNFGLTSCPHTILIKPAYFDNMRTGNSYLITISPAWQQFSVQSQAMFHLNQPLHIYRVLYWNHQPIQQHFKIQ